MKKIIIFVMLIFVLLVAGCFSGEISTMEKSYDNSAKVNSQNTQQAEEPKEKIIDLGEYVTINEIKFRLNSVTGYKKIGTSMLGKETKGEFYKVCLTLENLGKTSTYLYDAAIIEPQFVLVDSQGRQFDPNFEYELYIGDAINMIEQLQPGLPLEGCKLFELPANAEGLKLLISKGWLTNKAVAVTIKDSQVKHLQAETSVQDKIDSQMDEAMANTQQQMNDLMEQFS